MSADYAIRLNRAELLRDAEKVSACEAFEVAAGGSLHVCGHCDQSHMAHVVVALRERVKELELAR